MKTLKTLALLSFMAVLSLGVASCFNPSGPGNGGGSGDTVRHGRLPVDTIRDTNHHHRFGGNDTLNNHDTLIKHDTLPPPPPPPPPPPDSGGLDSNLLDSLLGHH